MTDQTLTQSPAGNQSRRGPASEDEVRWYQSAFNAALRNIESVVRGKTDQVAIVLSCFLSEGHVLIEDVPGTGKTTLAKALAGSLSGQWSRVQFTPDLLPSDVTGGMIYNQATAAFEAYLGPIFANVVLADEVNRASPKTQSALLEVMEERQVTLGNQTHNVPRPFVVLATQNPIEEQGTYQLPAAQLDRFLIRTSLGYASSQSTVEMLRNTSDGVRAEDLTPALSAADVARMIEIVDAVHIDDRILGYIVALIEATRRLPAVRHGASPRGGIGLMKLGKAIAAARGQTYVDIDDLKLVAAPVLAHRLVLTAEAEFQDLDQAQLIEQVLNTTPVPKSAVTSS